MPPLMFSQRNNPYCELLQICMAKVAINFLFPKKISYFWKKLQK